MMTREDYYAQIEAADRRFREYLMSRNDDDDETWTETDWWYRSEKENPEDQICNDEEYSSQISSSSGFNRPDPKPIYEIRADKEIPKASSMSKRRYKLQKRISCEEMDERMLKGLCVFCNELETEDHYLQHMNSSLLIETDNDEDLLETEVATEPIETKHGTVKREANAEVISAIVKKEQIPQIQVPISKLERGLKIHNVSPAVCEDSQYVVGCDELCEHQGSILQVSHVKERDVLVTESASVTINQVAHQLFDQKPSQEKRNPQEIIWNGVNKEFKETEAGYGKTRVDRFMLDHATPRPGNYDGPLQTRVWDSGGSFLEGVDEMFTGAKAVRMRFLLGIMLGITESYASQGQQAVFEKIVMVNEWLQTSLVIGQVMRDKKIKFTKQWMFKFRKKNIDEWLGGYNLITTHLENKKTWMFKYKAPLKGVQFLHYFDEVPKKTNWAVQRIWDTDSHEVHITDANKRTEYTREGRRWLMNIYDWCLLNQVFILIGSGSTYTFIDSKVAEKLGCLVESAGLTHVSVANGNKLGVKGKVDGFKWNFQSTPFEADIVPSEVNQLREQLHRVFEEPKDLPPFQQHHEHKIPLMDGANPVNLSCYVRLRQTSFVVQQVRRNRKIRPSKRWWFKYKYHCYSFCQESFAYQITSFSTNLEVKVSLKGEDVIQENGHGLVRGPSALPKAHEVT